MQTRTGTILPVMLLAGLLAYCDRVVVAEDAVTFYAMGDTPYTPEDDVLLPKQIAALPPDAEFVVHVGDIKNGATPCDEAVYMKVSGMLRKSTHRVFIVPGDNEWNDCADPAKAWKLWKKHFTGFDQRWKHRFPVFRQIGRKENFSFVHRTVLFVGLNIVGGRLHDPEEWKKRHAKNLDWTRRNLELFGPNISCLVLFAHAEPNKNHRDFFGPFDKAAA